MNDEIDKQNQCLNCNAILDGPFCKDCGQAACDRLIPVRDWLGEFSESFLSLDSKLLRTLQRVLFQPGIATIDFGKGRRVNFASPTKVYVIVSAVSIAAMTLQGAFSGDALTLGFGIDAEAQKKFQFLFPFVNLLSPFVTAGILSVIQHRFYFQLHLAFSLHIWTFFIAIGTPMIFIPPTSVWAFVAFFALVTIFSAYLLIAHFRVYALSLPMRIFSLLVLLTSLPLTCLLFSAALMMLVNFLP